MPLHYRRRGDVWHVRGTVRVGSQTVTVPENSTGCRARADAEAVGASREADIRRGIIDGTAGRAKRVTIADCMLAYLSRPGGVRSYDAARIGALNEHAGHRPVAEAPAAWQAWLEARGGNQKATSIARWRGAFQAALNHGCTVMEIPAPRLPSVKGGDGIERIAYLTDQERRVLLASYNPHAACPALVLAYQGMRTQEVLQLDWRRVSFDRRVIHIDAGEAKARRSRAVPMHPKVDGMLFGLWSAAGKPATGHVFLSSRGKPYADTRGRGERPQGGNPLSQAHDTACAAAGVTGFRVHDWRHDWATRMVWAGVDLKTLMELGGWASLRMVQRYASASADRMADAIGRLA